VDRLAGLIEEAAVTISGVVNSTPVLYSRTFSEAFGLEVYFKLENLQKTGSFKARGAYNKIKKLGRVKGVIAASSGNHAQGVAWAAALCKVSSVIGASLLKVTARRLFCTAVRSPKRSRAPSRWRGSAALPLSMPLTTSL